MKMHIVSALVAIMIAAPAAATDEGQATCDEISALAEAIMTARQSGVSLGQAMSIADGNGGVEEMVIKAWEIPRYSTAQVQRREIEDFRDQWHLVCVRLMRSGS